MISLRLSSVLDEQMGRRASTSCVLGVMVAENSPSKWIVVVVVFDGTAAFQAWLPRE